jgi:xanthine dehydrogenase YagR molybdenum-binding subunit
MKFDQPANTNPIDQLRVVGRATDRIDGPAKTTGTATYAYEWHDIPNVAYGHILGAAIAKGRILSMDLREARTSSGVLAIVTAENAGPLGKGNRNTAKLLGGPEIQHYHQAIAIVVAETFEQARAAAGLIRVEYDRAPGAYDLEAAKPTAKSPGEINGQPADVAVGDFAGAFAAAPVYLDATFTTPDQSHAMMEPHASIAAWDGLELTLWTSNQMIDWGASDLAKTLGIPKGQVRVISPFIGGGFGGKLFVRADALLAALGARAARRPVKVALSRPMMINNTTHRAATIQRLRIGATRDGKITAIGHENWSGDLPGGRTESGAGSTRLSYAGSNRMTTSRLGVLDLPEASAMRAPGEAIGSLAVEVAMDEMAEKLGLDPVEFRILNDTQVDPENPKRPFSQRQLVECLRLGAQKFGWQKRSPRPATQRDGRWWLGMGVAAAFRGSPVTKSGARVRLDARGHVTVETDMTDIGTGSYTILAQTAAEMMGLPLSKVSVRLGDSAFPVSSGSGGQFGGNSSTSGLYAACVKLREAVAKKLGVDATTAVFEGGRVRQGDRDVPLAEAASAGEIVAEDTIEFGDLDEKYRQVSFGAQFVELGVDAATAEVRLRRMLSVCAAGRILNPKTARSQVLGAMTMGAGSALMEELVVDKNLGLFINHDLAAYEVPVHADIPHQEVIFLDEADPISSPMKARGVGELGICGIGAAIANAIYNAVGIRVHEYPITLDKLIEHLPPDVERA